MSWVRERSQYQVSPAICYERCIQTWALVIGVILALLILLVT